MLKFADMEVSPQVRDVMEEAAAKRLHAALGNLDDLPAELSDTVAAIYYESQWFFETKSALRAREAVGAGRGPTDPVRRMIEETRLAALLLKDLDYVPKAVENLRKAEAEVAVGMFDMMVGVTNDIIKYRIPAHRMNLITRTARKAFKRPVRNLPGIYDRLRRYLPGKT